MPDPVAGILTGDFGATASSSLYTDRRPPTMRMSGGPPENRRSSSAIAPTTGGYCPVWSLYGHQHRVGTARGIFASAVPALDRGQRQSPRKARVCFTPFSNDFGDFLDRLTEFVNVDDHCHLNRSGPSASSARSTRTLIASDLFESAAASRAIRQSCRPRFSGRRGEFSWFRCRFRVWKAYRILHFLTFMSIVAIFYTITLMPTMGRALSDAASPRM